MNKLKEVHNQLAAYIRSHPQDSFQTISNRLGIAYSTVSRVAKAFGLSRVRELKLNLNDKPKGEECNDR